MKRTLLLLALTGTLTVAHADGQADKSVLEVRYEAQFRANVEDSELSSDEQVLCIGSHSSRYYSYGEIRRKERADSLVKSMHLPIPDGASVMSGMSTVTGGASYLVLKNYPADGLLTYVDQAGSQRYRVEEPLPAISWQLEEGDSVVAEYACQKAVGEWRGRTWVAWYTLDLPYSDGPWKLCGLPGTILAAHDLTGEFAFTCIAIRQGGGESIELEGKTERCTARELQAMKTREAQDPIGFTLESLGLGALGATQSITVMDEHGMPAELPKRTPVFPELSF